MPDRTSRPDEAQRDEAVSADTIASLAKETHQPTSVVKRVYEEQYARLKARARIPDYVLLLAARKTKDVLSKHI